VIAVLLLGGCASEARFLWEEYTRAGVQAVANKQYGRAEGYLTRAAEKAEALGPQEVGRSLNNLGELYRRQGRSAEAERYFTQALALKESQLGEEHPDVATSLNNLARLYVTQGRDFEAVPLLERSLAIQEKTLDDEHPALAPTLTLLAQAYRHLGRDADVFEVEVRIHRLREEPSPRR
jgi:tetratricopeptide (TPR) repeat protein